MSPLCLQPDGAELQDEKGQDEVWPREIDKKTSVAMGHIVTGDRGLGGLHFVSKGTKTKGTFLAFPFFDPQPYGSPFAFSLRSPESLELQGDMIMSS